MRKLLIGCSGWNYGSLPENNGGWIGVFYPDKEIKRLRYYSEFFDTAEMDASFYERFYNNMTKGTFIGMSKATPAGFQFSVKVPETITHKKRLDIKKNVLKDFEAFLEKISPLRNANKLGAILIQLPPSFRVDGFKNVESFLNELSTFSNIDNEKSHEYESGTSYGYQYALEFRNPSWKTEGPWELLRHYNIASVITDSPKKESLEFLSETVVTTADHSFVRFHGRNVKGHYWYDYLYSKEELEPWVEKIDKIREQTKVLRVYFNNHYGGKAVINALEFKEMLGIKLSEKEASKLENAKSYLGRLKNP
ncbi:MAG: DUF72 domain-containing protein [Nitrososphaeraceae archaeon]